jgi:4'-phosphopantetheinyl transferase EntD
LLHSVKIVILPSGGVIEQASAKLSARLTELFPPRVLAAELSGPGDETTLMPAEAQGIAKAVAKRRQEFAAGRACSRLLLREFGVIDYALLAADDRQPLWPKTLVGSITHTQQFCAAVVAESTCVRAIGIDSEISGGVKPELWIRLCTADERAWLETLETRDRRAAATLLFSAKEAFYKSQYPLTRQKLSFQDATIQVDWGAQRGAFIVHAPRAAATRDRGVLRGRFLFHEQFVTTGITLE